MTMQLKSGTLLQGGKYKILYKSTERDEGDVPERPNPDPVFPEVPGPFDK